MAGINLLRQIPRLNGMEGGHNLGDTGSAVRETKTLERVPRDRTFRPNRATHCDATLLCIFSWLSRQHHMAGDDFRQETSRKGFGRSGSGVCLVGEPTLGSGGLISIAELSKSRGSRTVREIWPLLPIRFALIRCVCHLTLPPPVSLSVTWILCYNNPRILKGV